MAGTIEFQGGTAAAVLAYTGAARQFVFDTDHWQGRVMDGSTPGGILLGGARRDTQTGTTYMVVTADQGKIITFNNASATAVTLPQAGGGGGTFMPAQSGFLVLNLGAGVVTITPGTSTINGLTTLVLSQYDGARVISDGTNYLAVIGRNATGGGGGGSPGGSTYALQYAASASTFGGIGPLTNGQLLIGRTGTSAIAATLTAGTGVSIANASGTITISATGVGSGLYAPILGTIPSQTGTGLTTFLSTGSTTRADVTTGIKVDVNGNGHGILQTASVPATPYTKTALVDYVFNSNTGVNVGIGWTDGTKYEMVQINVGGSPTALGISVDTYSNASTYVATVGGGPNSVPFMATPIFLQIADDGTNVTFSWGKDGVTMFPLYTVAKASGYLGSGGYSQLVYWTVSFNSAHIIGTLLAWF